MARPLPYNATVAQRIDLTESLAIFKIAPDEPPEAPWFIPGQYCVLGMNNEARPELGSVRRPMSIVSAPEQGSPFEFYIKYVSAPDSENPLTHLLWPLGVGDRLHMRVHAAGAFTLRETPSETVETPGRSEPRLHVLVAAGTGAAPFLSMLRSAVLRDPAADLGRYVFLHGAGHPAALGYRDELRQLAERHGLHYHATVSRPRQAPDWPGDTGRVEDYFLPERMGLLEARLGLAEGALRPDNAVIYVCGLQGTIAMCIRRLIARGFIPDHRRIRQAIGAPEHAPASLFFEQYDTTPVLDLKDESLVASLREALKHALAQR